MTLTAVRPNEPLNRGEEFKSDHVRSYVIRAGRITEGQLKAIAKLGPKYLIDIDENSDEYLDVASCFSNDAPLIVEIGFGMGKSFVQMAKEDPNSNFLGIEVHPPGVGSALKLIAENALDNVRIIQFDAFVVLKKYLKPQSIDVLQIFFPDPWPKKRHAKRRLINDEFVSLIRPLLKKGGLLRLATDWEDYALQMLDVLSRAKGFANTAADGGFVPRPSWRPLTKFEQRGSKLGHGVWDLVFKREQ